jgi:ankyrin repeat protein
MEEHGLLVLSEAMKELNKEAFLENILHGDLRAVESFLDDYSDVDIDSIKTCGPGYRTPLLRAIRYGHVGITSLLLDHGALVNGPIDETPPVTMYLPLEQACKNSYNNNPSEAMIQLLIEYGADVNKGKRETPLMAACASGFGVRQLLDAGADPNAVFVGIGKPLHIATMYSQIRGHTKDIEMLIEAGVDVNSKMGTWRDFGDTTFGSATALHYASVHECLNHKLVDILLGAGADPNSVGEDGVTPLHIMMIEKPSLKIVNTLLNAGCDPLCQDDRGLTALQRLSMHRHERIGDSEDEDFLVFAALVAAGDRLWEDVPTPCPGLETAMMSVWKEAPDELPEIIERMETPPQTVEQLFPHLDGDMKRVVQEILRVNHRHFPHLKDILFSKIFGFL